MGAEIDRYMGEGDGFFLGGERQGYRGRDEIKKRDKGGWRNDRGGGRRTVKWMDRIIPFATFYLKLSKELLYFMCLQE